MSEKISLDEFLNFLNKTNLEFVDWILEDFESKEKWNVKLNGLTRDEWLRLYIERLK